MNPLILLIICLIDRLLNTLVDVRAARCVHARVHAAMMKAKIRQGGMDEGMDD